MKTDISKSFYYGFPSATFLDYYYFYVWIFCHCIHKIYIKMVNGLNYWVPDGPLKIFLPQHNQQPLRWVIMQLNSNSFVLDCS